MADEAGFKENVELARGLREELGPDAHLMFDNHSIRYFDEVEYSVRRCKAVAAYKPFWLEEPICPEHLDGYARIKGETGVPIAGGEHLYTRWPVKAFLDRKCVDYVQSDPIWCGGISEWLRLCQLVRGSRLSISFSCPDGNPLRIEPLTPAELDSALAWRGKRVEFTGTSVAEAVALFNRQNQLQLAVADWAVGNLQLTGVFWANDPEGFVRLLSNGMKVQVTRTGNSVVLRSR